MASLRACSAVKRASDKDRVAGFASDGDGEGARGVGAMWDLDVWESVGSVRRLTDQR